FCTPRYILTAPPFFFPAPARTAIYTLSLHDALPICDASGADAQGFQQPRDVAGGGFAFGVGVGGENHLAHLYAVVEVREVILATDRKSTRLNSSHVEISYAVFCLKKKKRKEECMIR